MFDATPFLRFHTRDRLRRLTAQDPIRAQRQQLHELLVRARFTRFGREHDFGALDTVEKFQERVPLRGYEDFWKTYWQPRFPVLDNVTWPGRIPYFAVTSGTTSGVTKYIPCSRAMIRANHRAALDILVHHLANHPMTRVLAGRSFMLGGSTDLVDLAPGIQSGDLSGIMAKTVPWWARLRYYPPRHLETISDWQEKIAKLAPDSLEHDIRSISGTPSWLLLFIGSVILITAFTWDYSGFVLDRLSFRDIWTLPKSQIHALVHQYIPRRFNWFLFGLGELIILAGIYFFWRRSRLVKSS